MVLFESSDALPIIMRCSSARVMATFSFLSTTVPSTSSKTLLVRKLIPYTNIGYNYSNTANVNAFSSVESINPTYTNTYNGDGGIHEVYIGAGWQPFKNFSFGFNVGYLWGELNRYVTNSYSDAYVNTLSKEYTTQVHGFRYNFGLQYTQPLGKNDDVTLGLVYEPGHKTNSDPKCYVISSNSQTAVNDTASYSINNGISIPDMYGVGFVWNHRDQLKLGFDYQLQKWNDISTPEYISNGSSTSFQLIVFLSINYFCLS